MFSEFFAIFIEFDDCFVCNTKEYIIDAVVICIDCSKTIAWNESVFEKRKLSYKTDTIIAAVVSIMVESDDFTTQCSYRNRCCTKIGYIVVGEYSSIIVYNAQSQPSIHKKFRLGVSIVLYWDESALALFYRSLPKKCAILFHSEYCIFSQSYNLFLSIVIDIDKLHIVERIEKLVLPV